MVEVFKTNVQCPKHAGILVHELSVSFQGYRGNFDLDDCDKILRVRAEGPVDSIAVIRHLENFGYTAEVLSDSSHVK